MKAKPVFQFHKCPDGSLPITQRTPWGDDCVIAHANDELEASRIVLTLNACIGMDNSELTNKADKKHQTESARFREIYDTVNNVLAKNIRGRKDCLMAVNLLAGMLVGAALNAVNGNRPTSRNIVVSAINDHLK